MSDWQTTGTAADSPSAEGNYIDNLDIDNWADGATSAQKLATINRAEKLIERLTKDYFYSKAFVIYRNGNSSDYLNLSLVPDVLSVTEVAIFGIVLNTSWYTNDVHAVYLDPESATGGVDDPELMLRMSQKKGLFSSGTKNIKITGAYGWATTPDMITEAAVILCQAENDSTLYTRYDDVISDKLADAAYSRGTKKFLTGVHEADKLLMSYVRHKPIMA